MRRPLVVILTLASGLAACSGDDGAPADGPACLCDAPNDAASIDAATDARAIDAMMPDAPAADLINDCTEAAALDRTELADQREIIFPGFAYTPKCMKIRVGQTVTWSGDLAAHPLRPGIVVGGVRMAQPGNPIPATSSGATVSVNFTAAGAYGYYCNVHWAGGMKGAIYVVP